ncbi:hypothetical protein N665_0116s0028 [Sinapis alba]|nr:hypothetical protein N665_0116s0028 [Sinapis alba]
MSNAPESHWCYHCDKHVAVRTLDDVVLCCECNKDSVRSIQEIPAAYTSLELPTPRQVVMSLRQSFRRFDELLWRRERDIGRVIDALDLLGEGDDGGGVGGRRGAPPAAKSAVEALETFEVGSTSSEEGEWTAVMCAVCKDDMVMGDTGKKLPCGHSYHGSCILPWLETRNSCPVCRFQLRTDDPQYERKRKREEPSLTVFAGASSSSSMRGREENNDHDHVVETRRRSTRKRKPNRRFLD